MKKAVLDSRKEPGFRAEMIDMIVEGDRVAYEWTMSGAVDGMPKKFVGMTILRFKDGKILEDRCVSVEVK